MYTYTFSFTLQGVDIAHIYLDIHNTDNINCTVLVYKH